MNRRPSPNRQTLRCAAVFCYALLYSNNVFLLSVCRSARAKERPSWSTDRANLGDQPGRPDRPNSSKEGGEQSSSCVRCYNADYTGRCSIRSMLTLPNRQQQQNAIGLHVEFTWTSISGILYDRSHNCFGIIGWGGLIVYWMVTISGKSNACYYTMTVWCDRSLLAPTRRLIIDRPTTYYSIRIKWISSADWMYFLNGRVVFGLGKKRWLEEYGNWMMKISDILI